MSPAGARRANIATAALLLVTVPAATAHFMPHLLRGGDWLNLSLALSLAMAALSLNVLLGYAGQVSLGHAALLGVGAYTAGLLTTHLRLPMPLGFLAAALIAAAVAFLLGLPALRLRGLYLAIATVAFVEAMQYDVFGSRLLAGGSAGVALPRLWLGSHYLTSQTGYAVVCLLVLLVLWVLDANLLGSKVGRAFRAIRENESVAQSLGINVVRYKLLAFVVSGALAGVAGAAGGYAIGHVDPSGYDLTHSLFLVVIVIVGGAGRRPAVVAAGLSFGILSAVFTSIANGWLVVVGSLMLMFTVAAHPDGIGDLLALPRHGRGGGRRAADDDGENSVLPELPTMPRPQGLVRPELSAGEALLEVVGVSVRFGGLLAVDDVHLSVPRGSIVGLIGPNGAGKSTLFNAVTGLVPATQGTIRFAGREVQNLRCDQRARLGIARSFQQIGLAKDLTVRENFLLAQHQLADYTDVEALLALPRAGRSEAALTARADAAIEALGFADKARQPLRELSGGQQRIVEIGCLLVTAPELVLLDEPSAGMSPAAAESLSERLRDLRDVLGRTVLLIEHNVPLVLDTCDYVYVLDAGALIAEGPPAEIASNSAVIEAYFGSAPVSVGVPA